jgi:membrane protein required for colicin V production
MIETSLTYFDLAVLSVMVLSCLFAFFRGFVRELLSLGAWIGAGVVTLYYFRDVAQLIKPSVKSDMVAGGLATLGLYIFSLLAFSMFNSLIMRLFRDSGEVGAVDNVLGLAFGAFRGAFLISLTYFLMTIFISADTEPAWLSKATTHSIVERGAIILGQAAPDYMVEHTSLKGKIDKANGKRIEEQQRALDEQASRLEDLEPAAGGNAQKNVQKNAPKNTQKDARELDAFMDELDKEQK